MSLYNIGMDNNGKVCIDCGEFKLFDFFHKRKDAPNGYRNNCKVCRLIQAEIYRDKNRDTINAKSKIRYEQNKPEILEKAILYYNKNRDIILEKRKNDRIINPEKVHALRKDYVNRNQEKIRLLSKRYRERHKKRVSERKKLYREKNKDKVLKHKRQYYKENRAISAASSARRSAQKIKAVPPWVDMEKIKILYIEAKRLTKETGILHVVDHILPLRSNIICGLHVHTNLRVITWEENASKGNRIVEGI